MRSLNPLGGILFDDAIIGALICSATEINLIDWGRLLFLLSFFFQLREQSPRLHVYWVTQ